MSKKNLPTILHTGGTISSQLAQDGAGLIKGEILHQDISKLIQGLPNIKVFNLLSENLRLQNLSEIQSVIKNHSAESYIILVGTDRLTFLAKYLWINNVDKKIFLIGSQRSPDCPTFEGAKKISAALRCEKELVTGVYVVNYKNEYEYEFIDSSDCVKINSFDKNCYLGTINYIFNTELNRLDKYNCVKRYRLTKYILCEPKSTEKICVYHDLPNLTPPAFNEYSKVIIVGVGLLNISDTLKQEINKCESETKFYVITQLRGVKYRIYDVEKGPAKIFYRNEDLELAYLKLMYSTHHVWN